MNNFSKLKFGDNFQITNLKEQITKLRFYKICCTISKENILVPIFKVLSVKIDNGTARKNVIS